MVPAVKCVCKLTANASFLCTCVQTVGVDVNVPNADGATAVMLAVRDVDLFEGIAALLPWGHRPVAVLRKLLGLSV